jgi:alpha-tubulin suppressor-like RCC1 family protein
LGLGHTEQVTKISCIKSLKFEGTTNKVELAACGRDSSLVATNHGSIYGFGSNARSQLGLKSLDIHATPVILDQLQNKRWKALSMGAEHACALTQDGIVYVWGSNEEGQCGQLQTLNTVPVPCQLHVQSMIVSMYVSIYR